MPKYDYFCQKCNKIISKRVQYEQADEQICDCGEKIERVDTSFDKNIIVQKNFELGELLTRVNDEKIFIKESMRKEEIDFKARVERELNEKR